MPTRRNLIKAGLGLSVLPLLPAAVLASQDQAPATINLAVADPNLPTGRAFAHKAKSLGVDVIMPRGDWTQMLLERVEPQWRKAPAALAGVTSHGPMFVLGNIANRHGMRLVYSAAMTRWGDEECTVAVRCATGMGASTPVPTGNDADWGREMAAFILRTPLAEMAASAPRLATSSGNRSAGPEDDPVFVWVIAPVSRAPRFA